MKHTNTTHLMKEIIAVKTMIHNESPALYEPLNEPSMFISLSNNNISNVYFEQYLESLKVQQIYLKRFYNAITLS